MASYNIYRASSEPFPGGRYEMFDGAGINWAGCIGLEQKTFDSDADALVYVKSDSLVTYVENRDDHYRQIYCRRSQ